MKLDWGEVCVCVCNKAQSMPCSPSLRSSCGYVVGLTSGIKWSSVGKLGKMNISIDTDVDINVGSLNNFPSVLFVFFLSLFSHTHHWLWHFRRKWPAASRWVSPPTKLFRVNYWKTKHPRKCSVIVSWLHVLLSSLVAEPVPGFLLHAHNTASLCFFWPVRSVLLAWYVQTWPLKWTTAREPQCRIQPLHSFLPSTWHMPQDVPSTVTSVIGLSGSKQAALM